MGLVDPWPVGSPWVRDWTHASCIGSIFFCHWATREALLLRSGRAEAMGMSCLPICSRVPPSPSCSLVPYLEGPAYPIQKSRSLLPFIFFLRCRFSWRAHPQEFSAAELLAVLQEAGQLSVSWGAAHITSTAWGEHRTLHGYTRTAIQPLRQSGIHWDQVFLLFTPKWPFYMSLAEKGAFLLNLDSPNWALRHEEVEIGLQSLGAQKGRCQQIWAESRICSGSPRLSPVYIIM